MKRVNTKAGFHARHFGQALRRKEIFAFIAGAFLVSPAYALTFNVTWDSSTSSAPSGFATAFENAIAFYQNSFTNSTTINLNVGWGEVGGTQLGSNVLGASGFSEIGATFAQVGSALANGPAYLPSTDPTGGRTIYVSTANAKVLGFKGLPPGSIGGSVGFDSTASWTFDPNNRAQTSSYDFIGVAEHEISEVLGRYSALNPSCTAGSSCHESVLDLFRYTKAGTLDLTGTSAYFSMNGGTTSINSFYGKASGGDLGDWSGQTVDSFNYAGGAGVELPVSNGDLLAMSSLGYTLAAPVPEPGQIALTLVGLGLVGWRYGHRDARARC